MKRCPPFGHLEHALGTAFDIDHDVGSEGFPPGELQRHEAAMRHAERQRMAATLGPVVAIQKVVRAEIRRGRSCKSTKQTQLAAHECACSEHHADLPDLDARVIPHAFRHASSFGALDFLAVGGGLILVAPHDPLPLLSKLEERAPGAFEICYLEEGPEA